MSIFAEFEEIIRSCYQTIAEKQNFSKEIGLSQFVVELPRDEAHGDLASNAALVLGKLLKRSPKELAELFTKELQNFPSVLSAETAGPGFINIRLDKLRWAKEITSILKKGDDYGKNNIGSGQNVNIEFVSRIISYKHKCIFL